MTDKKNAHPDGQIGMGATTQAPGQELTGDDTPIGAPMTLSDVLTALALDGTMIMHTPAGGGTARNEWVDRSAADARADTLGAEHRNVYFTACEHPPVTTGRASEAGVTRWTAIWADLDVHDGHVKKTGGLADYQTIQAVIDDLSETLGTEPTFAIASGHGLQPVWVIAADDPAADVTDTDNRARSKTIRAAWQRALQAAAANHGGDVDSVGDLARVLRAPGPANRKDPEHPAATGAEWRGGRPLTVTGLEDALAVYTPDDTDTPPAAAPTPPVTRPQDTGDACPYAARMIAHWTTDQWAQRHQKHLGQAIRVEVAYRNGCLSDRGYQHARTHLDTVFRARIGGDRLVDAEIARAWVHAADLAPSRDVAAELGTDCAAGHPAHEPWIPLSDLVDTAPAAEAATIAVMSTVAHDADFWERESLAQLRDYALACMVSPWAVLGAAIVYVLDAAPPRCGLPGIADDDEPGSLNVFVALVGRPGGGKDRATATARRYLNVDGHDLPPGSGEGLAKLFVRRAGTVKTDPEGGDFLVGGDAFMWKTRHAVLKAPEVGVFAALFRRNASTLGSQLRQAFSGQLLGFGYADDTKRLFVPDHQYRLGLLVGVQPERADVLLNADEAAAGTPQRFVWMPADDARISRKNRPTKPDAIKDADWQDERWWPRTFPMPETATDAIMAGVEARARGEGGALDGQALYVRAKIAVAVAALDGRAAATDDDWALSGTVMAVSDETRARCQAALTAAAARENQARGEAEAERAVAVDRRRADDGLARAKAQIFGYVQRHGPCKPGKARNAARRLRAYASAAYQELLDDGALIATADGEEVKTS